jgi:hypothetical protein
MSMVSFDAAKWESATTLSGAKASDLLPYIQRLSVSDWSERSSASDRIKIAREIVDGPNVSAASELVLPWLVEVSRGRALVEQAQGWGLIGEVELGRLSGGDAGPTLETVLEGASEVALEHVGEGRARAQNEHAAMIAALPNLPDWGRMLLLRLVLIGQRYVACPACEELLDLEWEGHWQVGGQRVDPMPLSPQRQEVVNVIIGRATEHRAPALQAVGELSGAVKCPACGAKTDCMEMIAYPLSAP